MRPYLPMASAQNVRDLPGQSRHESMTLAADGGMGSCVQHAVQVVKPVEGQRCQALHSLRSSRSGFLAHATGLEYPRDLIDFFWDEAKSSTSTADTQHLSGPSLPLTLMGGHYRKDVISGRHQAAWNLTIDADAGLHECECECAHGPPFLYSIE